MKDHAVVYHSLLCYLSFIDHPLKINFRKGTIGLGSLPILKVHLFSDQLPIVVIVFFGEPALLIPDQNFTV